MSDQCPRPLSLILITVDCLRSDHVGFAGYTRPTTPFLDLLARESIVFPTAIVSGAPTYYSLPALLASRYPLDLGRDVVGLAPGEPSLATVLRDAGYATAAFCAGNPYLTRRFGYAQGFDVFCDFLSEKEQPAATELPTEPPRVRTRLNRKLEGWASKSKSLKRFYDDLYFEYCQRFATPQVAPVDELRRFPSADVLIQQALGWLDSAAGRPFFLWMHFMDPHAPYYPVVEALRLMGDEATANRACYQNAYWNRGGLAEKRFHPYREQIVTLYDAGIRWIDTQVAHLVDSLRHLQRWDDCVFVLTADHGEEFLEHGGRFHSPNKVTEELIRVPLLLLVPGQEGKRAITPFGLIHLSPTLLDILSIDSPSKFRGQSYWQKLHEQNGDKEVAVTECVTGATNPFHRKDRLGPRILAVRDKRFKVVYDFGVGQETLYDLERDPQELHPLPTDAELEVRARLLSYANRHLVESLQGRDQQLRCRALIQELMLEWQKPDVATLST
jgi:arylsulfatase A-like enzyme